MAGKHGASEHPELGYGDVDARPDVDGAGESSGGSYPNAQPKRDAGEAEGGQSEPGYSGGDNPNAPRKQ